MPSTLYKYLKKKIMDDPLLDPEIKDDDLLEEDPLDDIVASSKKPKDLEVDSLDALADEEEEVLPEDSFDDQDLW